MHRAASNRWFLSFFPYKMAFGAASVALPLFVVKLGGGVVDVGLVTAASVATSIPASIMWSHLSDRLGRRKAFVSASFLLNALSFLLLARSGMVIELVAYSALQGVFITACTAVSSMIILETFPRARWEREFSLFNLTEGVAWTVGLLLGITSLDTRSLFMLCSLLLLLSFALSLLMVEEPKITLERGPVKVIVPRLHRHFPPLIIHPPTFKGLLKIGKTLRDGLERNLPKYYVGTFVIFLGANLFFTPLPVFMLERGVPEDQIFLIFFLNSSSSTAFYPVVAKLSERLGDRELLIYALCVRCALFLSLAAVAASSPPLPMAHLAAIVLAAIGFTWSIIAVCGKALAPRLSALMEEGRSIGVYNAVTNLGSLMGTFFGGIVVYVCGYALSFTLAAELIALGAILFFLVRVRKPVVEAKLKARK
ncbi:MAG: MFS transporter [Candidatus Nezhaarchaeota archaeon]|nr:MFS transporter [Candidatus Nezhaarchaeota archaeon]